MTTFDFSLFVFLRLALKSSSFPVLSADGTKELWKTTVPKKVDHFIVMDFEFCKTVYLLDNSRHEKVVGEIVTRSLFQAIVFRDLEQVLK